MKSALQELISNTLSYPSNQPYAAILGESPSKGARSPLLWNAAFSAQGINAEMVALDITTDKLETVLRVLKDDVNFWGGAVAAPYKETIAAILGIKNLTREAANIGAVNCLYRDKNGQIIGTNTDGEGAVNSLEKAYGTLIGANVLLLGLGGAGKAVATYIKHAIGETGTLTLTNRNIETAKVFSRQINAETVSWPIDSNVVKETDILVNCTSVGTDKTVGETALADSLKKNRTLLQSMKHGGMVFDIIYDPTPTSLLELANNTGHRTLDGREMNLAQAFLGFKYVSSEPRGSKVTMDAMELAKASL